MSLRYDWVVPAALGVLIGGLAAPTAAQRPTERAAPAAAAPDPATTTRDAALDELVGEALANNPDVLAAVEAVAAANGGPEQARALPDPTCPLQYTNDAWKPTLGEREMTTLAVHGQPDAALARQAQAAGGRAPTGRDSEAKERVERAAPAVAAAVKRAYWALALARETRRLARRAGATWHDAEAPRAGATSWGRARTGRPRRRSRSTRNEQQRAAAGGRGGSARRGAQPAAQPGPGRCRRRRRRLVARRVPRELATLCGTRRRRRAPSCEPRPPRRERERLAVALARRTSSRT